MMRSIAAAAFALSLLACVPASPAESETVPAEGTYFAKLGEEVRPGGVTVRPLRVIEDSRCPASVQCVHAGTVRVAVRIGAGAAPREAVLRLQEPEPLGDGRVLWLVGVCPAVTAPGRPPEAGAYRLQLAVRRVGEPVPPPPICAPA